MSSSERKKLSLSRKRKANETNHELPQKKLSLSNCTENKKIINHGGNGDTELQITDITLPSHVTSHVTIPPKTLSNESFRSNDTLSSSTQSKIEHFFGNSNYKDTIQQKEKFQTPKQAQNTNKTWSFANNKLISNKCPSHKWIPGTRITVDAFCYGNIENCLVYCLTHFHSDHYCGLNKHFKHPIYCSKVTANLICQELKVNPSLVHSLPLDNTQPLIDDVTITLLDANHCPGSVMMYFSLPNGTKILHTGDFRVSQSMYDHTLLKAPPIDLLMLDTTYCSPQFAFPPQDDVISFVIHSTLQHLTKEPNTLIVCGTYTIGKEKIFTAIAGVLNCKAYVSKDKYRILNGLESKELSDLVTCQYPHSTSLHVLPLNKMNIEELCDYLSSYSTHYNSLLAFKPTGWTYSNKRGSLNDIRPLTRGPVTVYGVPYSEHSSFSELKDFVRFINPRQVISTVGGAKARSSSEKQCQKWLTETKETKQICHQLKLDSFIKKL